MIKTSNACSLIIIMFLERHSNIIETKYLRSVIQQITDKNTIRPTKEEVWFEEEERVGEENEIKYIGVSKSIIVLEQIRGPFCTKFDSAGMGYLAILKEKNNDQTHTYNNIVVFNHRRRNRYC